MIFADLPAVASLEAACFRNPWPLRAFQRELKDARTSYYVVAESDGLIVGYVGARIVKDEAHITTIGVEPEWRRRGTAKRLLINVIDHGLARKLVRLTLEVRESNLGARKLYESFGFVDIAIRRKYYHNPTEDAIIMWVPDLGAPEIVAAVDAVRASVGDDLPTTEEAVAADGTELTVPAAQPTAEEETDEGLLSRGLKAVFGRNE